MHTKSGNLLSDSAIKTIVLPERTTIFGHHYELRGTARFDGADTNGSEHYFAVIKDPTSGLYIKVDDGKVSTFDQTKGFSDIWIRLALYECTGALPPTERLNENDSLEPLATHATSTLKKVTMSLDLCLVTNLHLNFFYNAPRHVFQSLVRTILRPTYCY